MYKCWGLLRSFLCLFLILFLGGCGSSSFDRELSGNSGSSLLSDDNSIIQTRVMEDGHLEIFALVPPAVEGEGFQPASLPKEARETDFLSSRPDLGSVLAKNGTSTLYRLYTNWDMATDSGEGSYSNRALLDGGDGLYVTDFGMEFTRSRTTLPSEDGTYYYVYNFSNTKGSAYSYEYVYTKSGDQATLTFGSEGTVSYVVYQGSPLPSASLGMGILISSFFGQASEATQDSLYTGTWTITENLNGVIGETGQFDMRRIGIENLKVEPNEFNPTADEEVIISADVVALPVSTELTPDGWTPSGDVEWLVEIDDPAVARSAIRSLTGFIQPIAPDSNGKIATFSHVWDGKDSSGMVLLNATYIIRTQALANLSLGNTISKEVPGAVKVGNRLVEITNASVNPKIFNPAQDETAEISYEIKTSGFDNPNISWEVDVCQDGVPVITLPGGSTIGSTATASLIWDGKTTDGTPLSGTVEYKLRATACEEETQARTVSPSRHRVLFMSTNGICSFSEKSLSGDLKQTLSINKLSFPDALPLSDKDGSPFAEHKVYYDKESSIHHPVLLTVENLTNSSQSQVQRLHGRDFGEASLEIDYTVNAESEPQNYRIRVRRGDDGSTLVETEFTIPAGDPSTVITAKQTLYPEFEKKVQGLEFIKLDIKKNDEDFDNEVVSLEKPIYITLKAPKSPFVEGVSNPTVGMLDIATFLAADARTEGELRSLMLDNMCDWLKAKGFVYNPDRFHFNLVGFREDIPVGGVFSYFDFMAGFNGNLPYWQGDCEDLSALYAVLNLASGVDMKLVRVTGEPTIAINTGLARTYRYDQTFLTNEQKACAIGEGDPMQFGRLPEPTFQKWPFLCHQVATWNGLVWDPTFEFGTAGNSRKANGEPLSSYTQAVIDSARPFIVHPVFELMSIE